MPAEFLLERGEIGPRVVVTGAWSREVADYIRREQVPELYLNHARGWKGGDIEFLAELPALRGFGILDFTIRDVSPIHHMHELRYLEVATYCDTPVNFEAFPALERATFYWRAGSDSLFDRSTLKRLYLHRYSGKSSEPFSRLTPLESLTIANSNPEEVRGLSALRKLRFLGLHGIKKLRTLEGIEKLTQLEELEINECNALATVDELVSLTHLRRLQLNDDGKLASLAPLRAAQRLEEVLFYGSTCIVDGDLSPLASLRHLRNISFQNRKHYSHRRESFAGY
jgi:Leucine-rich repeat (LRR) protein